LYLAKLEIETLDAVVTAQIGTIGFRTLSIDTGQGDFRVFVNREPVFCRGAVWTPLDVTGLRETERALDEAFHQIVASGMNMIRVGGTMVYEDDAFLDRCDRYGVLLWQDFMFANMDYPAEDAEFNQEVTTEVEQVIAGLQARPSLAVLCGNSEGEQQAAMWGASRAHWDHPLFHRTLADLVRRLAPGVAYWPSSTHGGAFPHQNDTGSSSYYGVGAYLRPLEDARRSEVRFASECLAFANVPEDRTLELVPSPHRLRAHHSVWKTRAPRDLGAGWDFDDVRDHYLQRLFNLDPLLLRYADHDRYLELSRIVTGEVMAATFLEWRRHRSATRGALVWFLRDLWPGAGWGVIDSTGTPKPAWHYLRRALAPLAVGLTDEGGNGLAVHAINDSGQTFRGTLELSFVHAGEVRVGRAAVPLTVAARSTIELNAVALLDGFEDVSYAFRFGPPPHDFVAATLRDETGALKSRAVHFIGAWPSAKERDIGLAADGRALEGGIIDLRVQTRRFAQSVCFEAPGYAADDNYFHLLPGEQRHVLLRPRADVTADGRVSVRALNSATGTTVVPS
jgi:beta-mannosidase